MLRSCWDSAAAEAEEPEVPVAAPLLVKLPELSATSGTLPLVAPASATALTPVAASGKFGAFCQLAAIAPVHAYRSSYGASGIPAPCLTNPSVLPGETIFLLLAAGRTRRRNSYR